MYRDCRWRVSCMKSSASWAKNHTNRQYSVNIRGSHSFTCQPLTNHTCLYSQAAGHHLPLAGTHYAYPRRDARLSWPDQHPDTHPHTHRQHFDQLVWKVRSLKTIPIVNILCRSTNVPGASERPSVSPSSERQAGVSSAWYAVPERPVQERLASCRRIASRQDRAWGIRPLDTEHPELDPHGRGRLWVCGGERGWKSLLHSHRQSHRYVLLGTG